MSWIEQRRYHGRMKRQEIMRIAASWAIAILTVLFVWFAGAVGMLMYLGALVPMH